MSDGSGAILRNLVASDIPAAIGLSEEAGWNQTSEDWRMLIDLAPQGCLAIEADGQLAATTTLLCYGRRLAWIGKTIYKNDWPIIFILRRDDGKGLESWLVST